MDHQLTVHVLWNILLKCIESFHKIWNFVWDWENSQPVYLPLTCWESRGGGGGTVPRRSRGNRPSLGVWGSGGGGSFGQQMTVMIDEWDTETTRASRAPPGQSRGKGAEGRGPVARYNLPPGFLTGPGHAGSRHTSCAVLYICRSVARKTAGRGLRLGYGSCGGWWDRLFCRLRPGTDCTAQPTHSLTHYQAVGVSAGGYGV